MLPSGIDLSQDRLDAKAALVPPHLKRDTTSFSTVEAYEATVKAELELLETYQRRATVNALAHGIAADWYIRVNRYYLAYPATVLSLVTAVVSTQRAPGAGGGAGDTDAGLSSLAIAQIVLSSATSFVVATMTFLGYDELARKHNASADQYADLAGDIELFLSTRSRVNGRNILESFLRQQHAVMDIYDKAAPRLRGRFAAEAEARRCAGEKHVSGRCEHKQRRSVDGGALHSASRNSSHSASHSGEPHVAPHVAVHEELHAIGTIPEAARETDGETPFDAGALELTEVAID